MKYTIELKNEHEKNNLVELMKRGMAYCDEHYRKYRAMDNIYENVMSQLDNKKDDKSIEEMRKTCDLIWGWQAENWDDKTVIEYYKAWKRGEFNLR